MRHAFDPHRAHSIYDTTPASFKPPCILTAAGTLVKAWDAATLVPLHGLPAPLHAQQREHGPLLALTDRDSDTGVPQRRSCSW